MAARDRRRPQAGALAAELGEAMLRGASPDGLFACSRAGGVSFCDPAAARFLRTSRPKALGQDLADILTRLGDETLELRFRSALRDHAPVEFVAARPGRLDEWVEVRGLPVPSGMVFFLRDVTARERSERLLRRKERRLRSANESLRLAHTAARAATWEWRTGGRMRWLDLPAARALVGLPQTLTHEESIADWRSFVVPEDLPVVDAALRNLGRAEEAVFEYRVTGADGRHHWMRSSAAVVERGPDGAPARVSGVTLDVTPHKLAEAKLQHEIQVRRRAEQRQQLMIHELNHRVKNMLATVQSVARQSLGSAHGAGPLADFEDRLMALAWAHDVLTKEQWAGASLSTILARTMAPHMRDGRVEIEGLDLRVSPKMALALAMGVHELATNAVKYGALSSEEGRVSIRWRLDPEADPPRLILEWREAGGPPVTPPASRGFGSRLLEQGLARELGGDVRIGFEPSGVRCRISAPFEAEAPDAGHELELAPLPRDHGQPPLPH